MYYRKLSKTIICNLVEVIVLILLWLCAYTCNMITCILQRFNIFLVLC